MARPRKDDEEIDLGTCAERPKGSGKWLARYYVREGGRRREVARTFSSEAAGRKWLAEVYAERTKGTYVDPRGGNISLKDYAGAWRAMQAHHRPSTAVSLETRLRRQVYPFLGHEQLNRVKPGHIKAWVAWLLTEQVVDFGDGTPVLRPAYAASTVNITHGVLSGMFADAVANKVLRENPCEGTRLPDDDEGPPIVPLNREEVRAIHAAMPEHLRAAVVLAAGTGLRVSEVLGLTADRLPILKRLVVVNRQLVQAEKMPLYLGPVKTKASNREVPLPKLVVDAMADHMRRFPPVTVALPVGGPRHPEASVAFLFASNSHRPVPRSTMGEAFRAAADAAGLPEATFHDLRHHYASVLIRAGENPKVVQKRLGHATVAETLDTYTHLWPTDEDRTRQAIDQFWTEVTTEEGSTANG